MMDDIQGIVNDAAAWITVGGFIWHIAKPVIRILVAKLRRRGLSSVFRYEIRVVHRRYVVDCRFRLQRHLRLARLGCRAHHRRLLGQRRLPVGVAASEGEALAS